MKYFKVTYIPQGRKDKEWMVLQAKSIEELKKFFNLGMLIKAEEITKKEYEEYAEDI